MADIGRWLTEAGLGDYIALFEAHRIDVDVLGELTDADLKEIEIPLGDRKRLLKAIAALRGRNPAGEARPVEDAAPSSEAERRQLTLLFCDLVGSTALSRRLDPEDLRHVIGDFQRTCAGVVEGFEGFVAKYMGDGLLIYFGYPHAHEDDAERAVRAGLGIVEAVAALDRKTKECFDAEVAVRVGIATGPVVAGDLIGQGASEEKTVVGETPNLAARLQGAARPNTVVISADTRRLLGAAFECEDLGGLTVKGFSEPVDAWRALAPKDAETRFEAAHAAGLTPLVGREEEMELLLRLWRRARVGEGQVVLVSGEPGIGKSRITEVLRDRIADEPHARIRYQCAAYFAKSALYPFIEQLSRAAGFARDDTADGRVEKMEAMLRLAKDDIAETAPLVATLLSIPTGERYPALDLAPEQWKEKTFSALLEQMQGLASRRPLLIVFEDAHWSDPTSLDLLDRCIERVEVLPVLFIVTFRPDFGSPWVGQPQVTLLTMNRMNRRESSAMVERITGGRTLPEEVLEQILAKTDGVPMFVEELTKTVVESGLLVEEADCYRLAGPLPPLAIPVTLRDSLMARLDRLGPVKNVAQLGAVIGREFSHELLLSVCAMPEGKLREALGELVRSQLIVRHGMPPSETYMFKHALTHETAYGTLLHEQRRKLHGRIIEAIEQLYGDRLAEQVERLAHHAFHGEVWDRAVTFLRRAGATAAARSAYREAAASFEQALVALRHLPDGRETRRLGIDLRFDLRSALQALGEHEQVFEHLRDAETLAAALKDQHRLGWASTYLSQYLWRTGDPHRAEELGERSLVIAADLGDMALEAVTDFFLGQGYFNTGDYRRAIHHLRRNVAALGGERAFERLGLTGLPSVLSRIWLAWSLAERGEFLEALTQTEEALSIAEAAGQPYSVAAACLGRGQAQLVRGDLDRAIPLLERASDLCGTWNFQVMRRTSVLALGLAEALRGQAVEALPALEEWEAQAPSIRVFDTSTARTALANAYLLAARPDAAAATACRVAELAMERGFRGTEARTLQLLGEIGARREPPEFAEAEHNYLRALALADQLEMRPLVAHCHLGLGRLRRRQGNPREARSHVRAAKDVYRELDMPFWLKQAELEEQGLT